MRRFLLLLPALLLFGAVRAEPQMLRVAVDGEFPPFSHVDASGRLAGFDVDIARALCARLARSCEFQAVRWPDMIQGLKDGRYDAVVSQMVPTEERRTMVRFTDRYASNGGYLIGRVGGPVFDLAGSRGRRVGVRADSVEEEFLRFHPARPEVVVFEDAAFGLKALVAGKIDAYLLDTLSRILLRDVDVTGPPLHVMATVRESGLFGNPAIAVRLEDAALADAIDAALREMRADGTYAAINDRYFSFDIYGE